MKKRLIPFKLMPGSWGLRGKTREIAQAEYELDGIDLNIRLAEIEHGKDSSAAKTLKLDKELKSATINEYEYDKKLAELEVDDTKKALELLRIEFKHSKITKNEFEKQTATLLKQPWVTIEMAVSEENPAQIGAFELDWNSFFIEELRKNGYDAPSENIIIDHWFSATCATIAAENGIELPQQAVEPIEKKTRRSKKDNKDGGENIRREYR